MSVGIAFADKTLRLHVLDTLSLERTQVDQSEAGEITDYRFSPDSQWLAYTKPMPSGLNAVYIYSIRTGRSFPVSDPMHDDRNPRWDPAGKYLYFLSNRNINPVLGTFDFEHVLINTTEIYVVPLASDTPPPLKAEAHSAKFDLKKWATAPEEKKDQAKTDVDAKPAEAPPPAVAADGMPPADQTPCASIPI